MDLVSQQEQERRARILEAAPELLAGVGYGLTVRRLGLPEAAEPSKKAAGA